MLQTKTKRELEQFKQELGDTIDKLEAARYENRRTKIVLSSLMDHLNLQYRQGKKRSYIARIPGRHNG